MRYLYRNEYNCRILTYWSWVFSIINKNWKDKKISPISRSDTFINRKGYTCKTETEFMADDTWSKCVQAKRKKSSRNTFLMVHQLGQNISPQPITSIGDKHQWVCLCFTWFVLHNRRTNWIDPISCLDYLFIEPT